MLLIRNANLHIYDLSCKCVIVYVIREVKFIQYVSILLNITKY